VSLGDTHFDTGVKTRWNYPRHNSFTYLHLSLPSSPHPPPSSPSKICLALSFFTSTYYVLCLFFGCHNFEHNFHLCKCKLLYRPVARRVQVGAMHPLGICKMIKHADLPTRKGATSYRTHVFICWTAVVGNNSFSKMYVLVYARCFVQCYRSHYVIKVFILWSWLRRFLRLCIHNIYIYIMSITEHYTRI
jgi:hypothetical protein